MRLFLFLSRLERIVSLAYYQYHAHELAARYQQIPARAVHGDWLRLLEPWLVVAPRRLLDVGAGSGRDAAFLAGLNSGNNVVAVEPCHAFSALGQHHTRTLAVTWVNDSMPALSHVIGPFDLILLSAVWMHLSLADRPLALARLGELLSPQGYLVLSLRFSVSEQEARERAMFPVSLEEVEYLARKEGLTILHASALQQDVMARGELSWQSLILGGTHARLP
ncbi:class I SAM-dependent methyltransferase [Aeromonas hydrophila]|uniref:class I SAM-dependent methyltransferase n=1 Tax=Aeromonas hydrophila TaxID=644 RepID=UPI0029816FF8|nr:class I SAM-dependent methyltransferase [Aeromonas hydrophila]